MSAFFVLLTALVLAGLGWTLACWCDRAGRLSDAERLGLGFSAAALFLHLAVYAVGHWRLDLVSMTLLAAAFTLAAIPGLRAMPWVRWRDDGMAALRHDRWTAILLAVTAAVLLSGLLQGMAPPNDYDSLMYHMSIPLRDVAVGRMEIAWNWQDRNFFPILVENLARFGLVFTGTGAAQMLHGLFAVATAVITGALVRRLGGSVAVAVLGALLFVSIRTIVWEMATVQVEVAQAAYCAGAALTYMVLRRHPDARLAIVFGLMIAGALHTKYTSLLYAAAFAPIMLWDLSRRRIPLGIWLIGPVVAALVFMPHVLRTLHFTGNPVFPLLNPLFNPGAPAFMEDLRQQYGIGRDVLSLVIAPWSLSVDPLRHFDGVVLGGPILLALAPFAWFGAGRVKDGAVAGVIALGFYLAWFYLISQQVRFLAPIFPMLSAFAALGAANIWQAARSYAGLRHTAVAGFAALALTQGMFVGIYSALRLPVALGLTSAEDYLTKTPTMDGSHYLSCKYIADTLAPGQKYLSLLAPHFSSCPTDKAVILLPGEETAWMSGPPPEPTAAHLLAQMEALDIRLIIVQPRFESRRNATAVSDLHAVDMSDHRLGRHLMPILSGMHPLFSDKFTDVYDGVQARQMLRTRLNLGG